MKNMADLTAIKPILAVKAQRAYDQWEQDKDGLDPELGPGGICHEIADAIADTLNEHGIETATISQSIGEQHVYAVALVTEGIYAVDIPPSVYETGGGYVWKKIPGVLFGAEDIITYLIEKDISRFDEITSG